MVILKPCATKATVFRVVLFAEVTAALLLGVYMLRHGSSNPDRGWYLFAGRRVYQGALPYRDFAFFQGPLSAYVYGIPALLGWRGVMAGELVSLAMMLVTLGASMRIAYVHGGRLAAVLVPPLLLNALTLWNLMTVKTEPISTMLLVLVAYVLLERELTPRRAGLAWLLALLAVLTRVSMLPILLLVVVGAMYRFRKEPRVLMAFVAGSVSAVALCAGAVAVLGPRNVWFDLVLSQSQRDSQWAPVNSLGVQDAVRLKSAALHLVEQRFPVTFAAGLLGSLWAGVAALRWLRWRRVVEPGAWPALALVGLAMACFLPLLAPRTFNDIYFVPSAVLIAIAVAIVVGRWRASLADTTPAVIAAVVLVSLQLLPFNADYGQYTRGNDPDLARLRAVAQAVRDATPPGKQVVTLDLAVALEAGRDVPDELSMGIFAYYPQQPDDVARRRGLVNLRLFRGLLNRPNVSAAVLSDYSLGVLLSRCSCAYSPNRVLTEAELKGLIPELSQFRLSFTGPPLYGGFSRGSTYVLRRI